MNEDYRLTLGHCHYGEVEPLKTLASEGFFCCEMRLRVYQMAFQDIIDWYDGQRCPSLINKIFYYSSALVSLPTSSSSDSSSHSAVSLQSSSICCSYRSAAESYVSAYANAASPSSRSTQVSLHRSLSW